MYIALATFRLKAGVDEETLLKASDEFEKEFVQKQRGISRRLLLRNTDGSYADLVFFESKEDADRVLEAEQTSPEFFSLMEVDEESPNLGVLYFHQIKTYGKQD